MLPLQHIEIERKQCTSESYDCVIFEGSMNVSFAAYDIPLSHALHFMTSELKNKIMYKRCAVSGQFLCKCNFFKQFFCSGKK